MRHKLTAYSGKDTSGRCQAVLAPILLAAAMLVHGDTARADDSLLVEAESFSSKGGWKVDQQFDQTMGSCYLLAHGLGQPVANAETAVTFPEKGRYHLWVRTKNWVPGNWDAPGRFRVIVAGKELATVFGTESGWTWQYGGPVDIPKTEQSIELRDLTGFDGRCDALYFSTDKKDEPPNDLGAMAKWRRTKLGQSEAPPLAGEFDVIVVGGGIAGCGASIAAGKMGMKVALIHDRPLLGGNASSEVRVHTLGLHGKGADILEGLDTEHWKNGSAEAIPDTEKRHKTMNAAEGVKTFLSWRAYAANTKGKVITSVDARNNESGERKRFTAPVFIDCTGDGWIGYWAGAEYSYGRESADTYGEAWEKHGDKWSPKKPDKITMGTSLLWNSERDESPVSFPDVPWATDVAKENSSTRGGWNWEHAAEDKHQIDDAEEIRDHMLRAIYGSFSNAKKDPKNASLKLTWVGYVGGKRESRRLVGDYIYTMADATEKRQFPDAVVEEKREIDVHYQRAEHDFRSSALFYKTHGTYYIPFRCLYSKNISNLMMAGRCFSCSHIGLGGPRVMNTTGQMGIATGYAAALCREYSTTPRGVYEKHIQELRALIGYEKE